MKLGEYLDQDKLEKYVQDGIVDKREHNTLPLAIYCYSRRCTYDNIWNDVTCLTRGIIVETKSNDIVARPFEKFFNLNHEGRIETNVSTLVNLGSTPYFSDKLDGSMGTLWHYKGHAGIATKGSFHSEQAEWATQWWLNHTKGRESAWPVGYTPIFEIIAQSVQHHVIHYFPHEDNRLVLLGLINKEMGAEMEPEQLAKWASINGLKSVTTWFGNEMSIHQAMTQDRPNREGYVATWYQPGRTPIRVKIKHQEFLNLQKIAHHTTPKTIFNALRSGDQIMIAEALKFGSSYLQDQVKVWMVLFDQEYQKISIEAREIVKASLTSCTTRKESAEFFLGTNKRLAPVCFNLIDGKDHQDTVWDLVEPLVKTIKFDEVEDLG